MDAAADELSLLAALRQGDARAYEQLVAVTEAGCWPSARRMLRHEEEARDAVQEAFLLAFRGLPRLRGPEPLSEPGCTGSWSTPR